MAHEEIALQKIQDGELSIDNNGIIWRHYITYANKYGRFTKNHNKPIKAGYMKPSGYWAMNLCENGKMHQIFSHRVVFLYFNNMNSFPYSPNPRKDLVVNHINGNKADNRKLNLELVTSSEDKIHCIDVLGKNSKINKEKVKEIIKLISKGAKNKDIANIYGVSRGIIGSIRQGAAWARIPRLEGCHKQRRLNKEEVKEILILVKKYNDMHISKLYGISRVSVGAIRKNETWKRLKRNPIKSQFSSNSILSEKDVKNILRKSKSVSDDRMLAKKYNVSTGHIQNIRLGRTWQCIPRNV